jgi:TetR/AcrR family transcriptional repressor of nem operon
VRKSKLAAAESRTRIVETASRMLRSRGLEATSLADVMHAAGMTHGGFYKHFGSKGELVDQAARAAFADIAARFDERERRQGREGAVTAYIDEYLSSGHIEHPEAGCPMAAFGADAGRTPEALAPAFHYGAEMLIARIASNETADGRAEAIRTLATLVGAVIAARAVGKGSLREEILAVCAAEFPHPPQASKSSEGGETPTSRQRREP